MRLISSYAYIFLVSTDSIDYPDKPKQLYWLIQLPTKSGQNRQESNIIGLTGFVPLRIYLVLVLIALELLVQNVLGQASK